MEAPITAATSARTYRIVFPSTKQPNNTVLIQPSIYPVAVDFWTLWTGQDNTQSFKSINLIFMFSVFWAENGVTEKLTHLLTPKHEFEQWNMQLVALNTANMNTESIKQNESCHFCPLLTWGFGTFFSSYGTTSLWYTDIFPEDMNFFSQSSMAFH